MVFAEAIIDFRFENLDLLAAVLGAFDPPHELFRFAAKHTSTNDFDESGQTFMKHVSEVANGLWDGKHAVSIR